MHGFFCSTPKKYRAIFRTITNMVELISIQIKVIYLRLESAAAMTSHTFEQVTN